MEQREQRVSWLTLCRVVTEEDKVKSVKELIPQHRAQLFNYLRITKKPVGLLINFGRESLQGERYAFIEETNECVLLDKNMELLYEDVDWEYEEPEDTEEINL